jgi:hypothetical protein
MLHSSKPFAEPKCCGAAIFAMHNGGLRFKGSEQNPLHHKKVIT